MPARNDSPALIALWRHLLSGQPFCPSRTLDEEEVAWAIETGMGPLLYSAAQEAPGTVPDDLRPRLRAADRWARVRHEEMLETTAAIVDRCADRAPPLTLLKGISIAGEFYPVPYHRVLGDLDLLVEPDDAPTVMAALDELGYRQSDTPAERDFANHHHLRPVCHPQTQVCVEVHTGLFPPSLDFDEGAPFSREVIRAESRPSTLEGRRVLRLSSELQVVYIASHWALDFVPTAGAHALLDMTLLLRGAAERIDWKRVVGWLGDRRIAAHLQLMLSYLDRQELVEVPPGLRVHGERLAVLSPAVLRILNGMINRYQIRGLMRHVTPLLRPRPGDTPSLPAGGTLPSRIGTLHTAARTRNIRGLLRAVDLFAWETLLCQPPSGWRAALVPWCLVFPPGDPDRFAPRSQR